MRSNLYLLFPFLFFLSQNNLFHHLQAQPSTEGFTCSANQTTYPCKTYAFYRASSPDFLDLASIGDLFSVSRLMISKPSNISSPTSRLYANQPLFVPLSCSCNTLNSSFTFSYANLSYTIKKGNTFYLVSTNYFQNLTTYQAVEVVNPTLIPTQLEIGVNVIFPIFCKCPNKTQLENGVNYLLSYVFQPSDNLSLVASRFGVQTKSIVDVNGNTINPFDTIFIPVKQLPGLDQPVAPPVSSGSSDREGLVRGLAIGLGIVGILLVLVLVVSIYRDGYLKRRRVKERDEEEKFRPQYNKKEGKGLKGLEVNLISDVSQCLDKYRVFEFDELKEATNDFDDSCLIQGSVYRGSIDGEVYAIKKMNWNACEQLKILQKVNHGNLVKLEGFCIDQEDMTCYLVCEYIENGSLYSWLHGDRNLNLDWKTRLRIAIDVANGLQYIHEHTRPKVVHKDIKSSNILLDTNLRAKIANFGLAKSGCNAITMHIVGTQGYIAPEYLADGMVSTKTDVFSFGVILLELVSGKEAIDDEGKILWAKVDGMLEGSEVQKLERVRAWMDEELLKGSYPMDSVMNVMAVAIACLQKDPSKRPSMLDVVYALSKSDDLFFDISDDGSSPSQVLAR